MFAVPEPVITLLFALLFIVVDVTAANVESPLKKVEELAVPDPNLAVGTVPDAKSDASKLVKFAPLIAGSVPVKFAAGMLVKFVAAPLNDVAVTTPVKNPSPSGLIVTPDPTLRFPLNVETPVANTSPSELRVTPDPICNVETVVTPAN